MAAEPLQLVVRAGEAIICPGCGAELLVFAEDVYGLDDFRSLARPICDFGGAAVCCCCSVSWSTTSVRPAGFRGASLPLAQAAGPRIHLRSGTWTGWRAIGGE